MELKLLSEAVSPSSYDQTSDSQVCPDCSDIMVMVYDWDRFNYLCENCGLMLAKPSHERGAAGE
jgi:ribosomal protein S27AE